MTAPWKLEAERDLLSAERSPAVLPTSTLFMFAMTGRQHPPSTATVGRWIKDLVAAGKIIPVTKGVYLNRMGHPDVTPADAAWMVRAHAFVSLTWVLEQAGITNNFGDTITCVIPIRPDWPNPQISDRQTAAGTFRFFAMPDRLVRPQKARLEDLRDLRFAYERASPEKAFLDMLYLGASSRSRMTPPPFDLEFSRLDKRKLVRLASAMGVSSLLEAWSAQWNARQKSPSVIENELVLP